MAAKTIMKRIAIAALSAVILQGVTPLDSLNVYASENTGASYTALDLYTYMQDQCSTEYTLTEKAETFLEEHDDFFPASPELVIPDEMIDAELDFRHINKNPSRYGDKLMRISDAYVIQVQDKTTPRLIQFHTLKNAVNPPFLGGFLISGTVAA